MDYRLCLVIVLMKMLQNGRGQIFGARLAGSSVTKTVTLLGVSIAAVFNGIHKSWEDIISYEDLWPLRTATTSLTTRIPPDSLS